MFRQLSDVLSDHANSARPSVCIVTSELVGPFKNGGVGTSMTGLAELLAASGFPVTVLYTGSVWSPELPMHVWTERFAALGITLVPLQIEELAELDGPLQRCGFAIPALVYQFLNATRFDVVHFNDCGGEGYLCIAAKRLGRGFLDTLFVVALHSPSQWTLELNQIAPSSLLLSASNYAERLSIRLADLLWSPSRYLLEWVTAHGFVLPEQTFVQQYCLPSARVSGTSSNERSPGEADGRSRRTAPPRELVFFGRLEERKGLRGFCDAVEALGEELVAHKVGVVFLGKPGRCADMDSLDYLAQRSRDWPFAVSAVTNLGQAEALDYLRGGSRLAVMPAPEDNSPCTVYEALSLGLPFLAARGGGVPELVHEADHTAVLFDPTAGALMQALRAVIKDGGTVARPSRTQTETRRTWLQFHADAKAFLPPAPVPAADVPRVSAIVDASRGADLAATLASLAALPAVQRIVVVNRGQVPIPLLTHSCTIRVIDPRADPPATLDDVLPAGCEDVVLLVHGGVTVLAEPFSAALSSLWQADADGLVPAGQTTAGQASRIVPPLGADAPFSLFEGTTFTGGLLVRRAALQRAADEQPIDRHAAFLGLADACVIRGLDLWPCADVVFTDVEDAQRAGVPLLPERLAAYNSCSDRDRYYMQSLAKASPSERGGGFYRRAALAMVRMGLSQLLPPAARIVKRARRVRARTTLDVLDRRVTWIR